MMARGSSLSGEYKVVPASRVSHLRKQGWDVHGSGSQEEMQGMKSDWDDWHQKRMQNSTQAGWRPTE